MALAPVRRFHSLLGVYSQLVSPTYVDRPPVPWSSIDMNCTSYHDDYMSQPQDLELWESDSQYAPTPGNFRSPYATQSDCRPSPSISLEEEPNVAR